VRGITPTLSATVHAARARARRLRCKPIALVKGKCTRCFTRRARVGRRLCQRCTDETAARNAKRPSRYRIERSQDGAPTRSIAVRMSAVLVFAVHRAARDAHVARSTFIRSAVIKALSEAR